MAGRLIRIIVIAALSALLAFSVPVEAELARGLFLFSLIGMLWLTETLPVSVTALLVPVMAVALEIFDLRTALASFAHPIIYLFFGGMALATALRKHGIDQWIAASVLSLARGRLAAGTLLMFLCTAALSMWISNTATTAMMLPLAIGMLARGGISAGNTSIFVLLGLAWSANIGGIGTLVGSPPNAIAAAQVGLQFTDWLRFGIPAVILLLPLSLAVLWFLLRPEFPSQAVDHEAVRLQGSGYRATLLVFLLTVMCWIGSAPLSDWLGVASGFDSLVAIAAVLLLVISGSLDWDDIEHGTNWGVLVLFGGGLALSAAMKSTGASVYLATLVSGQVGDQAWLLMVLVAFFVVFMTELVSNTASAALLVPLFVSVAASLQLSETTMAATIAICASCAFMLPVATPPNALVYGTGRVPQPVMMRVGLVMNLLSATLIALMALFLF